MSIKVDKTNPSIERGFSFLNTPFLMMEPPKGPRMESPTSASQQFGKVIGLMAPPALREIQKKQVNQSTESSRYSSVYPRAPDLTLVTRSTKSDRFQYNYFDLLSHNIEAITKLSDDILETFSNDLVVDAIADEKQYNEEAQKLVDKLNIFHAEILKYSKIIQHLDNQNLESLIDLEPFQKVTEKVSSSLLDINTQTYKEHPLIDTNPDILLNNCQAKDKKTKQLRKLYKKIKKELTAIKIKKATLIFFSQAISEGEYDLKALDTKQLQENFRKLTINKRKQGAEIAAGGQGKIYKDTIGNDLFVRKEASPRRSKQLRKEVLIRLSFHSDYVIKPAIIAEDMKIFYPLASFGDLRKFMQSENFSHEILTKSCYSIARGLSDMHLQGFVHRDVKPDNVLIFDAHGKEIKITDLGLATKKSDLEFKSRIAGTTAFMAPEVIDEQYNEKADVWSFGMTLFEMLTNGNRPFPENLRKMKDNQFHLMRYIERELTKKGAIRLSFDKLILDHQRIKNRYKLLDPHEFFKKLMLSCFRADPSKRPSMQEISEQLSLYAEENKITL